MQIIQITPARVLIASTVALFSFSVWGAATSPPARPSIPARQTTASAQDLSADDKLKQARFSPEKMDRTVDPRKDFVKFAAGIWYDTTQIPSDKSRWGGFDELAEANWARIREVINDTTRHSGESGSARQKVADLYMSAMDTDRINALGLAPIAAELEAIGVAQNRDELMRLAAGLHLRPDA